MISIFTQSIAGRSRIHIIDRDMMRCCGKRNAVPGYLNQPLSLEYRDCHVQPRDQQHTLRTTILSVNHGPVEWRPG
jgi:hypothetical protein